ncbi:MAG: hypothetical protein ACXVC6_07335 [Bacteroidia bacterium]
MFLVSKQKASGEGRAKAAPLLLFLVFMIVCVKGYSCTLPGKDTIKSKYELNDPRNPNCPCHKHQQQAENEYRQLQDQTDFSNVNKLTNGNNLGNDFGEKDAKGFGFVKVKLNLGKISFSRAKGQRKPGQETSNDKKGKTNGIFWEIYAYRVVRMKFPVSKSHTVKHRKMKGRFGDKLSRCFHF